MNYTRLSYLAAGAAALLSSGSLLADSISPTSYADTLAVGESVTIKKTVTITKERPTSALVDVFFLADTTGSMGGAIANVKAGAASIMSSVAGLGDVNFAVGEYKDSGDAFAYKLDQNITSSTVLTQAGINAWTASGGGDLPEANLYALERLSNTTSWRPGSTRILVWFGDATGHDPSLGVTEAAATAALVAKGIKAEAINVGNLNATGQASRIAAATGGAYFPAVNTAALVATITSAITTSFDTYAKVALDVSEAPAGVEVTYTPGSYVGSYDRSIDRTFDFDVTFKGVSPGDYSFNIYGTVDGGRVATEADRISVKGGSGVPDGGSTLLLLGGGLTALGALRRKF